MNYGRPVLTQQDLESHISRQAGNNDIIWDPLYDFNVYLAAGQTNLSFFTVPIGAGATSAPGGAGVKTIHDTNMVQAGQLGLGVKFFCVGLEILFFPATPLTTLPPERGAQLEAALLASFMNDVWVVSRSGLLTFQIGSNRVYSQQAPLGLYPPTTRLACCPALTGAGATANTFGVIDYAVFSGEPYSIVGQYIESTQPFNVTLSWPGVVALPSTIAARIGVRLRGYQIRNVQ